MSLVNQVLNDLEKRGVNALPGDDSIRVVHAQGNRLRSALTVTAMLALLLVAAGLWWNRLQPGKTAPSGGVNLAPTPVDGKLPAFGGVNSAQPMAGNGLPAFGASLADKSVAQVPVKPVAVTQAESHPVAAMVQEAPHQGGVKEDAGEVPVSAMRLSFELSSIPLPSSLRPKAVATASLQHRDKPALPSAPAVKSKTPVAAQAPARTPAGSEDRPIKQVSAQQQADNEFRKASGLMQQGYDNEALAGYEAALRLDAGHDEARQALVGLLLKNRRNADAESVLQDGLKYNPKHSGYAMLLARLQVERDALPLALDTLQKTLPYADQQPDYQAFVAALLQRQNRQKEAITHYQIALQLSPNSGVWLMGLGISLQAIQRNEEARDVFKRAIESQTLSAELQAFVKQRLKEL